MPDAAKDSNFSQVAANSFVSPFSDRPPVSFYSSIPLPRNSQDQCLPCVVSGLTRRQLIEVLQSIAEEPKKTIGQTQIDYSVTVPVMKLPEVLPLTFSQLKSYWKNSPEAWTPIAQAFVEPPPGTKHARACIRFAWFYVDGDGNIIQQEMTGGEITQTHIDIANDYKEYLSPGNNYMAIEFYGYREKRRGHRQFFSSEDNYRVMLLSL